jgi:hypothetical protein
MKLTKEVILCDECQFPYHKALWEPMWLARIAAKPHHPEWHTAMTEPEKHKLIKSWRDWERQTIVADLQEHYEKTKSGNTAQALKYRSAVLACIEIAKGQTK